MDFLKSAVASAIAKGSSLPYTLGDQVENYESLWTLHNATKKDDGSPCSIFTFDVQKNKSRLPLATNALRKLRTLRHPGIIRVYDTIENETTLSVVAERLIPLPWHLKRKSISNETAKWGLYTVASTIRFINDDAKSVHGNVRTSSIYTSESGEWKLAGVDALSSMKEEDAIVYRYGSLLPDSARYAAPEVADEGWSAIKKSPISAPDAFGLGVLVFEVFNSSFRGTDQLSQVKAIPPEMAPSYRRLVNKNPKARISAGQLVELGRKSGGFFETPLIRLTNDIENFGLKDESERTAFLRELDALSDDFPEEFFRMKVLPELLKAVEYGGGGPKALEAALKIGLKLSDDDFATKMTPVIIRLFASPDRAIRVCLLDNLPSMVPRLSQKDVSNKIFPSVVTGFSDVAPIVREQTVKAVLSIVGKLTDRIINGELLRYLAKSANDDQPGIRTNTTICLGKIAKHLAASSRSKVLVAAFSRALRDPFVHGRNAALMAFSATMDFFSNEECATKILPSLCGALVDKEKIVRDQADITMDLYLARVRKYASTMAETALPTTESAATMQTTTSKAEASGAASWAGWAVSSFTNKMTTARGDMEPQKKLSANVVHNDGRNVPSASNEEIKPATSMSVTEPSATRLVTEPEDVYSPSIPSFEPDEDFAAWDDPADRGQDDAQGTDDKAAENPFDVSADNRKPATYTSIAREDEEPDFAGWLAAQSQSKAKKPLPKGISRLSKSRPNVIDRTMSDTTGGGTNVTKVRPPTTKPVVKAPTKKIDTAPKEAELMDDGWGDDWD